MRIWCNAKFPPAVIEKLRAGLTGHELVLSAVATANNLTGGVHDPALASCVVAFGQPDPRQVIDTPAVKWVSLTSAGYTRYDTPEFKDAIKARGGAFTNASSVYNEPCAQHLLAMMLAFSRQLPAAMRVQPSKSWPYDTLRYETFLLKNQTVIFYGFGAIGQRLAQMLAPFSMNLIAVRRKLSEFPGVKVITFDQADALLKTADHVVNTLPEADGTDEFFNADRFGKFKHGSHFYNIGRGTTVDQQALLTMLETHRLAGAYLDVTMPEPLPLDSPLWTAPHCCITPHIGGGHINEFERQVDHFAENVRRYTSGQLLLDRIV